mmetsp:Transcript_14431/g.36512  ORF Transcript_14431/g.36512 Transcript_14431/m.36512 type:complete len:394 (-) Transcript_14431:3879-5060(-)
MLLGPFVGHMVLLLVVLLLVVIFLYPPPPLNLLSTPPFRHAGSLSSLSNHIHRFLDTSIVASSRHVIVVFIIRCTLIFCAIVVLRTVSCFHSCPASRFRLGLSLFLLCLLALGRWDSIAIFSIVIFSVARVFADRIHFRRDFHFDIDLFRRILYGHRHKGFKGFLSLFLENSHLLPQTLDDFVCTGDSVVVFNLQSLRFLEFGKHLNLLLFPCGLECFKLLLKFVVALLLLCYRLTLLRLVCVRVCCHALHLLLQFLDPLNLCISLCDPLRYRKPLRVEHIEYLLLCNPLLSLSLGEVLPHRRYHLVIALGCLTHCFLYQTLDVTFSLLCLFQGLAHTLVLRQVHLPVLVEQVLGSSFPPSTLVLDAFNLFLLGLKHSFQMLLLFAEGGNGVI